MHTYSRSPRRLKRLPLVSACLAALLAQSAMAQTDQSDQDAAEEAAVVEEVVVMGVRYSLDSAAEIKRGADQMVDAISAEDIGMFSDNNIGEALQRVPGVQLERDMGEGFRISIRGLGPRFVRTTVNGRTALSTAGGEDGNGEDARGFTLNMMPSEVITRVTVEKSTQAKNLEGGMGGTVDMQTVRPVDFADRRDQDFYISAAGRVGYNDLVDDLATRGSLFLNKKFNDNFGVYFGMVLDNADRVDYAIETESFRVRDEFDIGRLSEGVIVNGEALTQADLDAWEESVEGVGPNGEDAYPLMFNGVRNTARSFERRRDTFTTGVQWANEAWDINFDWTYGKEQNDQLLQRYAISTPNIARSREGEVTSLVFDYGDQDYSRSTPTYGSMMAFEFEEANGSSRGRGTNRYIPRDQEIHVGGINVDWQGDLWSINGDIGYAEQKTERPDLYNRVEMNSRDDRFDELSGFFDAQYADGVPATALIGISPDGTLTPFGFDNPDHHYFRSAQYTYTWESADDTSARIDFTRELPGRDEGDLWSLFDAVMFGVAWNERTGSRKRGRVSDDSGDIIEIERRDPLDGYQMDIVDNFRTDIPQAVHSMLFMDINDPVFDPMWSIPPGELPLDPAQAYDITEDVLSFYVQMPFSGGDRIPYRGNVGLRYVMTDQTGIGAIGGVVLNEDGTELLDEYETVVTNRTYDEPLPSFNIAFDLTEAWVLRMAASRTMSRPDPIDMTSYVDLNLIEDTETSDDIGSGRGGNPDLEPYFTSNFDVSLEWYPETGGAYALGLFYKDVDGWISRGRSLETFTAPVGVDGNGNGEFDEDDITDGIPGNGGDYYEIRESVYDIRRKVNTDGGTIKGVEFAFHQPFDAWTDGFWSYFGVNGSVTYVDAEMDAVVPENNLPISLRGTSEWSGNLVAYFERKKFSVRVAANYRDDFLFQEAEDPFRSPEWTEGSTIVELNMDYKFNKNLRLRFSANNLTGETRRRLWETAGAWKFSDDRDNGQYYTLELRYRM